MPIPTKLELKVARDERNKHLDKRAKLSAQSTIENISNQILGGRDKVRAFVTNPRTVNYVLEAFRKKGYDVEAKWDEEDRKGSTLFVFNFEE